LRAAWDRVFSRKWLKKDRIVPELHPQLGVTHHYRGAKPKKQTNTSYLTNSWAGAGTKTGKWTSVISTGTKGGWNSSSWLGLDWFCFRSSTFLFLFTGLSGTRPYSPTHPLRLPANIANFPVKATDQVYCGLITTAPPAAPSLSPTKPTARISLYAPTSARSQLRRTILRVDHGSARWGRAQVVRARFQPSDVHHVICLRPQLCTHQSCNRRHSQY
jgi:hypothetical protein